MNDTLIRTPCVGICRPDPETGWCLGCGRTLFEISDWTGYSDAERERIMTEVLPARVAKLWAGRRDQRRRARGGRRRG